MENYIVSARKYRPSTFESVVGQKALTTTLKNAISTQKLAHAYLFCGPRGVGKTTCARIFAKTINCLTPTPQGEACNTCESCVAFNEQRSYNIHELDAASNNSVDDIRQLVDQVRIPPQIGKYKVYIIDEVHMLSASAFNAFLKTLEEPPRHAIFILATTEKHKILPTILSRCQIYDFNRITVEDTVAHLQYVASQEGVNAEPEALSVIALKADGGMRDALSIFDQVVSFTQGNITYSNVIANLNVLDYEYYFRLTDSFLKNDVKGALLLFNDVLNHGFDGGHFVTGLSSHFRDLLVSKDEATLMLLEVGASIRQRYKDQAQHCPATFIYKAMKLCNDCDLNYRASKNKRLLVELTLIQLAQLTAEDDGASHGRGPKQTIKPIATSPAQAVQQPVSPQATQSPQATNKPQAVASKKEQAAALNPSASAASSAAPSGMPSFLAGLTNAPSQKVIPTVSRDAVSTSLRNMQKTQQQTSTQLQQADAGSQAQLKDLHQPFDERMLNYHWMEFATHLPQESRSMAMRMQNIKVKLLNDTDFEVVLDNELMIKEFNVFKPRIEAHLRSSLRNSKVTMTMRVSEDEGRRIPLSNTERFQAMAQKNSALTQLKDTFGLEIW